MCVATQSNINLANLNLTRENKSWTDAFILEGKARYGELGVKNVYPSRAWLIINLLQGGFPNYVYKR